MLLNGKVKGIKNSGLSSRCLICLCGKSTKPSRIVVWILGFLEEKPGIFKDQKNTLKNMEECR